MGHDLRNPLNAIVVSSALLSGSGQLDEHNTHIALQIADFAKVMNGMIHDLLDFTRTRLGGGMPISSTPIDLESLCRDVVNEFRAAYPHRVLRFESFGDTRGEWDAARLRQVVSNLLANAMEHGSKAGAVELHARGDESEVFLAVKNEGDPIPAAALPTLFDPFVRAGEASTTKTMGEGIGLGLYIARAIVIAHGGSIGVTSSATAGTVFTVYLPRRHGSVSSA